MSIFSKFEVRLEPKFDREVSDFVKKFHYSKNIPRNSQYYFTMWYGRSLIGVIILAIPVGANVQQKYSKTGKPVLELRRMAMHPSAPKNSCSFMIGHVLRYCRKYLELDGIISYADSGECHFGTPYLATNFQYLGLSSGNNSRYRIKGSSKWFHSRQLYQIGTKVSNMLLKAKKEGKLISEPVMPKHQWYYSFN